MSNSTDLLQEQVDHYLDRCREAAGFGHDGPADWYVEAMSQALAQACNTAGPENAARWIPFDSVSELLAATKDLKVSNDFTTALREEALAVECVELLSSAYSSHDVDLGRLDDLLKAMVKLLKRSRNSTSVEDLRGSLDPWKNDEGFAVTCLQNLAAAAFDGDRAPLHYDCALIARAREVRGQAAALVVTDGPAGGARERLELWAHPATEERIRTHVHSGASHADTLRRALDEARMVVQSLCGRVRCREGQKQVCLVWDLCPRPAIYGDTSITLGFAVALAAMHMGPVPGNHVFTGTLSGMALQEVGGLEGKIKALSGGECLVLPWANEEEARRICVSLGRDDVTLKPCRDLQEVFAFVFKGRWTRLQEDRKHPDLRALRTFLERSLRWIGVPPAELVARPSAEDQIDTFIRSDASLCFLVGALGSGKSSLVVRLVSRHVEGKLPATPGTRHLQLAYPLSHEETLTQTAFKQALRELLDIAEGEIDDLVRELGDRAKRECVSVLVILDGVDAGDDSRDVMRNVVQPFLGKRWLKFLVTTDEPTSNKLMREHRFSGNAAFRDVNGQPKLLLREFSDREVEAALKRFSAAYEGTSLWGEGLTFCSLDWRTRGMLRRPSIYYHSCRVVRDKVDRRERASWTDAVRQSTRDAAERVAETPKVAALVRAAIESPASAAAEAAVRQYDGPEWHLVEAATVNLLESFRRQEDFASNPVHFLRDLVMEQIPTASGFYRQALLYAIRDTLKEPMELSGLAQLVGREEAGHFKEFGAQLWHWAWALPSARPKLAEEALRIAGEATDPFAQTLVEFVAQLDPPNPDLHRRVLELAVERDAKDPAYLMQLYVRAPYDSGGISLGQRLRHVVDMIGRAVNASFIFDANRNLHMTTVVLCEAGYTSEDDEAFIQTLALLRQKWSAGIRYYGPLVCNPLGAWVARLAIRVLGSRKPRVEALPRGNWANVTDIASFFGVKGQQRALALSLLDYIAQPRIDVGLESILKEAARQKNPCFMMLAEAAMLLAAPRIDPTDRQQATAQLDRLFSLVNKRYEYACASPGECEAALQSSVYVTYILLDTCRCGMGDEVLRQRFARFETMLLNQFDDAMPRGRYSCAKGRLCNPSLNRYAILRPIVAARIQLGRDVIMGLVDRALPIPMQGVYVDPSQYDTDMLHIVVNEIQVVATEHRKWEIALHYIEYVLQRIELVAAADPTVVSDRALDAIFGSLDYVGHFAPERVQDVVSSIPEGLAARARARRRPARALDTRKSGELLSIAYEVTFYRLLRLFPELRARLRDQLTRVTGGESSLSEVAVQEAAALTAWLSKDVSSSDRAADCHSDDKT